MPRATWLAALIAAATVLVFAAFGGHVFLGGAWETRTAYAMSLRSLVWLAIAIAAWRAIGFSEASPAPRGNKKGFG